MDTKHVVVVGGGVAGLEATLALHALAADRVHVTLLSPSPEFMYRPMTLAEPLSVGRAHRLSVADLTSHAGATLVLDELAWVGPTSRRVRTAAGDEFAYDALVVAIGVAAEPAFTRALTFSLENAEALCGLLRDIEEGYVTRVAIVIPEGPHWVVPGYELALMLARGAYGMGHDGLRLTIVTPEPAPLALLGPPLSRVVATDLAAAGIAVETDASVEIRPGHTTMLAVHPGDRRLDVDRVVALPMLSPRRVDGLPTSMDGYLSVDAYGRVDDLDGVYAAGDCTRRTIKHAGLASLQADAVASHIASGAGAPVEPEPFVSLLSGRLLTGRTSGWLRHEPGDRGRTPTRCLWWPPGKVVGRYLAPYVAGRDATITTEPLEAGDEVELRLDLDLSLTAPETAGGRRT